MKSALKILLSTLIGFCLASYLFWELPLIPRGAEEIVVKIPRDAKNAQEILAILHQKRILKYPKPFGWTLSLLGWDKKIQRGTYKFRDSEAWPVLLRKLLRGEIYGVRVTLPEGWLSDQIAERLEAVNITNAHDFLKIVKERNLEGFLFPSTYFFEPEIPAETVVDALYATFERVWRENFAGLTPPQNMAQKQIITLASIIERETTTPEEKPVISGIFLNRLKQGWKLEADPTVQYALGGWKSRITYQDLKIDSPYNTYQRYGLPPGPISNPGIDSIRAVFEPTPTDYMYFVAKGDGTHAFFATLKEHNKEKSLRKKQKKR